MQYNRQMPMPQVGRNYGPTTSYGVPGYNNPPAAYGTTPSSLPPYGTAVTSYGPTSYSGHIPAAPSQDSAMDLEMKALIDNLTSTVKLGSAEDLDGLLKNEDKLNSLIEETPQLKSLQRKRNELINSNKEQATFNLSLQPQFEGLKERLSEAVLLQSSKKEEYDILKSKLESLAGSLSLDTTLALLQTSAAEKDSASETLANELLDCKLPLEDFIEKYISERTFYHLRKIKADKMAEIVRRGPQTQQQAPQYYGSGYGRY